MDREDIKKIGERMKAIRGALKLLQKDMAKELEISPANLSEIESGAAAPRHEAIYNLSKKFNVNIYYLLHGKGGMFQSDSIERSVTPEVYGANTGFLKEFLKYFRKSSLVRYEMMSYFRTSLLENEVLIEKDIKRYKQEQDQEREKRSKPL
jgi:transcriptional regulator with XRE-family HTH domain